MSGDVSGDMRVGVTTRVTDGVTARGKGVTDGVTALFRFLAVT